MDSCPEGCTGTFAGASGVVFELAKTGPVVLSGDLYHYPERAEAQQDSDYRIQRLQTIASRTAVEAFLKKTGAQLWIQHDFTATAKLKKAPAFYD